MRNSPVAIFLGHEFFVHKTTWRECHQSLWFWLQDLEPKWPLVPFSPRGEAKWRRAAVLSRSLEVVSVSSSELLSMSLRSSLDTWNEIWVISRGSFKHLNVVCTCKYTLIILYRPIKWWFSIKEPFWAQYNGWKMLAIFLKGALGSFTSPQNLHSNLNVFLLDKLSPKHSFNHLVFFRHYKRLLYSGWFVDCAPKNCSEFGIFH